MREVEKYFLGKSEPAKSCLLALRGIILAYNDLMTETLKYGMPCYCYNGKMFCYLWTDRKTDGPYILIVEGRRIDHPALEQGERSRMKLFRVNPDKDIPVKTIHTIFGKAIKLYPKTSDK